MEKLTYSNVIQTLGNICVSPSGIQFLAEEDYEGKFDFKSTRLSQREKDLREMYREGNQNLATWKKGLKKLIKIAKKGPSAMDHMAGAYTGNGCKSNIEYFWKLFKNINNDDISKLGTTNDPLTITGYVNGEFDVYFNN